MSGLNEKVGGWAASGIVGNVAWLALVAAFGIVSGSFADAAAFAAAHPVAAAVWSLLFLSVGIIIGMAARSRRAAREAAELKRAHEAELSELRGYEGGLANFSLLSPEMKQLLHELEDGMLEVVVNKGEHRRWIASGELVDLGYLCEPDGFYQMYRVVRLTAPARRALLMHRDDWEKAKAADGIPDGSIFASDNELDVPEPTIAQLAAARTVEAFARAQR